MAITETRTLHGQQVRVTLCPARRAKGIQKSTRSLAPKPSAKPSGSLVELAKLGDQRGRQISKRQPGGRISQNVLRAWSGWFTWSDLTEIIRKQKGCCYYCGIKACRAQPPRRKLRSWLQKSHFHIEHKTPVSRGGSSFPYNLCVSCPECNLAKGTMTEDEFKRARFEPRLMLRKRPRGGRTGSTPTSPGQEGRMATVDRDPSTVEGR